MADEEQTQNQGQQGSESGGSNARDDTILREQMLVNERQDKPKDFGATPTHSEEERTTPKEEIEPQPGKRDIQTQGS